MCSPRILLLVFAVACNFFSLPLIFTLLKKCTKTVQALRALKVIKLLRNLVVLKAGLNFRIFLRLKVHVLRAGRSSWSLFCPFCKKFLNSLSTSSWRWSESLVSQ